MSALVDELERPVITEDRSWAEGMTQEDFEREFQRRFPESDVVPDAELWRTAAKVDMGFIDGVSPGDVLADDDEVKPPKPEEANDKVDAPDPEAGIKKKPIHLAKGKYPCRGCGEVFEYKIARSGHERGCKAALNKRTEEVK